ncbi:alpha-galactosidase [Enterococcus alcedinis]|uniref:Alpha-galactosidase n=1 Tax=Enterococcus alcedinis TaxID=1274384 RepID=A0A917N4C9_9ENTE|nr:alpha-galactosidase [Enterococcus alcedinis]MBP2101767.1 hypothetical protein [Enterococcus alcedinis]GGI65331.1 hypothetical protein GCM10011482_09850 [Enterococcus alcedinis]
MKKILPPIMGWSSWNYFRQSINEEEILAIGHSMTQSGLKEAGYQYINLDDCWHSSKRNQAGELQFDLSNFPSGEKIIEELHKIGLKVGLYSSSGSMTCEDLPGSYEHEKIDAQTFARWGVDFLKYDYCHVVDLTSDEKWLIDAPYVNQIEFYDLATKEKIQCLVEDGDLCDEATLHQEEVNYVSGLEAGKGKLSFNQSLDSGTYAVTIKFKKRKNEKRQLLVLKLDEQEEVIHFPTSSGWSLTGREQMVITLDQPIEKIELFNPIKDQKTDGMLRYKTMSDALLKAYGEKEYVFSICEHGRNEPWTWAQTIANQYRIDHDIRNSWDSVLTCYQKAVAVAPFAKEGSYGDPDMLEVGNGALSEIENESHFALWAFLSAPLILGNDVREFMVNGQRDLSVSNRALEIVTNPEIIRFNQSQPYLPAVVIEQGAFDVLVKVLVDDTVGILVFNKGESTATLQLDLATLPKKIHDLSFEFENKKMVEVWNKPYVWENNQITLTAMPHESHVFKI